MSAVGQPQNLALHSVVGTHHTDRPSSLRPALELDPQIPHSPCTGGPAYSRHLQRTIQTQGTGIRRPSQNLLQLCDSVKTAHPLWALVCFPLGMAGKVPVVPDTFRGLHKCSNLF